MATVTEGPEAGPSHSQPHSALDGGISENGEESLLFPPGLPEKQVQRRTPKSLGKSRGSRSDLMGRGLGRAGDKDPLGRGPEPQLG